MLAKTGGKPKTVFGESEEDIAVPVVPARIGGLLRCSYQRTADTVSAQPDFHSKGGMATWEARRKSGYYEYVQHIVNELGAGTTPDFEASQALDVLDLDECKTSCGRPSFLLGLNKT